MVAAKIAFFFDLGILSGRKKMVRTAFRRFRQLEFLLEYKKGDDWDD